MTPLVRELADLLSPFQTLLEQHLDAAALYDVEGQPVAMNQAAKRLRTILNFADLQAGSLARGALALATAGEIAAYEARVRSSEGNLHLRVDLTPIRIDGIVCGVLEMIRELWVFLASSQEDADAKIGLPPAEVLFDRISRLLIQLRRDNRAFALHLFTVATPEINDDESLGAELRRLSAQRLLSASRQVDTVAKLGRAFVVIQPEINDFHSTTRLIERLTEELQEPIAWNGVLHVPIVFVGSAIASRSTASAQELFVEADLALARLRGSRIINRDFTIKED